ncbi:MAG: sulfotransferase domain-containing protein [Symploca sp. SIO2B6]|nr:sulfotransferase domain-containing protein [Symploca sp. SIO2B6]
MQPLLKEVERKIGRLKKRMGIIQRSPYENIYYCCTQKTASQWFAAVFEDYSCYQYMGLDVYRYAKLGLKEACLNEAIPKRTIGTHLYISYPTYLNIPKPANYKTFFILRDPRDVVVSFYFSAKYSHGLVEPITTWRPHLQKLDFHEGLKFMIDAMKDVGYFEVQRSWTAADVDKKNVKIFRYEDLANDNQLFLKNLFDYLNIKIPEDVFIALCDRHKFENKSGGRNLGEENLNHHYRKGASGDWINHFDSSLQTYFKEVTKDLVEILGYSE